MLTLTGKTVVVIGASRGVGRRVVETSAQSGARVLAVARGREALDGLKRSVPGVETLAVDASEEEAPFKVFEAVPHPHILVLSAGAFPPAAPLHEQTWKQFAVNWETDVKIAFQFIKAALLRPLPAGTSIVTISSGAALAGSPISGGYAGAKRTQMFIANYGQKESDRLGLDLRFITLTPRLMPDSELGRYAVAGYSRYLRMPEADFIQSMGPPPTSADVANAVMEVASGSKELKGKVFVVSGKGLEGVPA